MEKLSEEKRKLYWWLSYVAIFLLIPVDMVTTIFAAFVYGADAEANWIIASAIQHGPVVFGGINLVAGFLASILFFGLLKLMDDTEGTEFWVLARSFEVWVGFLIIVGAFVAANNIAVVLTGQSLV